MIRKCFGIKQVQPKRDRVAGPAALVHGPRRDLEDSPPIAHHCMGVKLESAF